MKTKKKIMKLYENVKEKFKTFLFKLKKERKNQFYFNSTEKKNNDGREHKT